MITILLLQFRLNLMSIICCYQAVFILCKETAVSKTESTLIEIDLLIIFYFQTTKGNLLH